MHTRVRACTVARLQAAGCRLRSLLSGNWMTVINSVATSPHPDCNAADQIPTPPPHLSWPRGSLRLPSCQHQSMNSAVMLHARALHGVMCSFILVVSYNAKLHLNSFYIVTSYNSKRETMNCIHDGACMDSCAWHIHQNISELLCSIYTGLEINKLYTWHKSAM